MPAAETAELEISTDAQHRPLIAAAGVLFFHGEGVPHLNVHRHCFPRLSVAQNEIDDLDPAHQSVNNRPANGFPCRIADDHG